MKIVEKIGLVSFLLVGVGGLLIYVMPLNPSDCFVYFDASYDLIRAEGKRMLNCLEDEREHTAITRWPSDNTSASTISNSTVFFNSMMSGLDDYEKTNLFRSMTWRLDNNSMSNFTFTLQNNYWIVIKNIPADAPGNVIVLATRNIDPKSLRIRITKNDMTKTIQFAAEKSEDSLKNWAVLIRKDGKTVVLPRTRKQSRRESYGFIYKKSFDLTTNLVNGMPVKYLTPTGEVMPTNE